MPRTIGFLGILMLLIASRPLEAQEAGVDLRRDQPARSPGAVTAPITLNPTPEMWFYAQERERYDNPKMAIRRRAEERANERHARMVSLAWYGLDNSRPTVSVTPVFGSYSAYWGANSYDPFRWRPSPAPLVVVRPILPPY